MKIAVIGGNGLVGSRVVELLEDKYTFVQLSRTTGVDILQPETLKVLDDASIDLVLHMAAYTNVDGAEEDKDLGEQSQAWKVNVTGTKNIVEACLKANKKIIYISTDFIFDGEKGRYTEEDTPNPVNWYGKTKYEGENIVKESGLKYVIARIAYPYRTAFEKKDFMRAIKSRLESGQTVKAVTDHIFTPTFIDDVAYAIEALIIGEKEGIFHIVGSQSLSPYEAALRIADSFGLDKKLIFPTTRKEYFASGAKRPFDLSLENGKIRSLGIKMSSFEEGLVAAKRQL